MEITTTRTDNKNPFSVSSPNTNNGGSTPLSVSLSITRSDYTNPYPTTFVQADTTSFKQVVQMLTGSSETAKQASSPSSSSPRTQDPLSSTTTEKSNFVIPPIKTTSPKKQSNTFKLYERRQSNLKNSLIINTLMMPGGGVGGGGSNSNSPRSGFSPRNTEILSPSLLNFPKLALNSPVTPLRNEEPFNRSLYSPLGNCSSSSEEDKAIAEKGFYFHPSPISTPRESDPQLLPLFPVTSPKFYS